MTDRRKIAKFDLRNIAHGAMLQRGLLPDFSAAVVDQVEKIRGAATGSGSEIRDLRHLLWASIDDGQFARSRPAIGGRGTGRRPR